jgi:exodeoxyribonuclease VII small subunit
MAKGKKEGAGPLKFEAALEKLEKIVEEMESGDLPLEGILKKYEEGNALAGYCAERLRSAEKRIEILMKNKEGSPVARPFQVDDEDDGGKRDEQLF